MKRIGVVLLTLIALTVVRNGDLMGQASTFSESPLSGPPPLLVHFVHSSVAEGASIAKWYWDFESDGILDDSVQNPVHTYFAEGIYDVTLKIVDTSGYEYSLHKQDYIRVRSVNVDSGLVLHYPFDGDMLDWSSNGNDLVGTAVVPAPDRFGNAGKAYEFTQDSSHMISIDSVNITGNAGRSISVWFKSSARFGSLCGWGKTDDVGGLSFMKLFDSRVVFNGHWVDFAGKRRLTSGGWAHACFTYDGDVGQLFINGLKDTNVSDVPLGVLSTIPTPFNVGYEFGGHGTGDWNTPFKGVIDDIRVYNRALSEDEVLALVFEGSSAKILLLSPNGSERFSVGSKKLIEWAALEADSVVIEYSTDNGASWLPIASNVSCDSGSYKWVVPNTTSTECRVRVTNAADPSQFDISDGLFTIYFPPRNSYVEQILGLVNVDSLTRSVQELSGETETVINGNASRIITRAVGTTGNDLAQSYLAERLCSYGLSVELQSYDSTHPGRANVVAVQAGSISPGKNVIICAHYDNSAWGDTVPGADDNASGVAAVIEAARLLSRFRTDATIVYALWNDEETSLGGSLKYAQQCAQRGDSIVGVINIDMIGWDANNDGLADIHAKDIARSPALADTMKFVNEIYSLNLAPIVYNPGTTQSDHSSFWNYGFSSILLIEAYWGGDFNWDHLHSPSDKIQFFNFEFFQSCSKLAIATAATMAGIDGPVSVVPSPQLPERMMLCQNYPNPFNPATMIKYQIPSSSYVSLKVYDIIGREVATLVEGIEQAGYKSVNWDAGNMPSGIYFYRLSAGSFTQTRKLILLK